MSITDSFLLRARAWWTSLLPSNRGEIWIPGSRVDEVLKPELGCEPIFRFCALGGYVPGVLRNQFPGGPHEFFMSQSHDSRALSLADLELACTTLCPLRTWAARGTSRVMGGMGSMGPPRGKWPWHSSQSLQWRTDAIPVGVAVPITFVGGALAGSCTVLMEGGVVRLRPMPSWVSGRA